MTRYELFKFLHVVGAIAWVGGGIGLTIYGWRLRKARDLASLAVLMRRSDDLGKVLFMPAALLTLGFGIAMVATTAAIAFGDLWILMGFGGVALSIVVEAGMAAPAGKRFVATVEEHETGSPQADAHAGRMLRASVLGVLVLLTVVWAMVAKPML
jgi:uncharacterized membrane protein